MKSRLTNVMNALMGGGPYLVKENQLSSEEKELVSSIAEYFAETEDRWMVDRYINGMMDRGGLKYLQIAADVMSEQTLPSYVQGKRYAEALAKPEHLTEMTQAVTNIEVNLKLLSNKIKAHEYSVQLETKDSTKESKTNSDLQTSSFFAQPSSTKLEIIEQNARVTASPVKRL